MPWSLPFSPYTPLHVESVAWVAERKDVLSTFLEMVALLFYVRYAEMPTAKRYLPVLLAFAASAMAKPMVVTFPVILLLLDYWPLRRLPWPPRWSRDRRLFVEKAPMLLISFGASVVTVIAQGNYGTVATLEGTPIVTRIANASTAYVVYIRQAFWPTRLGALYPVTPSTAQVAVPAFLFLLLVTFVCLRFARTRPYLATGWLWYLCMLVPVIGLIQVGAQAWADRYMYVPLVGLTVAIVWGVADWLERHPALSRPAAAITALILLVFAIGTWRQAAYWKDSRTLFEHTIAITDRNFIMQNNLGVIFARAGDDRHAMVEYMQAMRLNPDYAEPKGNAGNVLLRQGQLDSALSFLKEAVRLKPDYPLALRDLGIVETSKGTYPEAIGHLSKSASLRPEDPVTHSNLCYALEHSGRLTEAVAQCP